MSCTRRRLLQSAAIAPFLKQIVLNAQVSSTTQKSKLAVPGLFPGRVIGVEDTRSIASGRYNAEVIKGMMHKGMQELTGADWVESWKLFAQKGERIGIKVNPVGQPHCISAPPV
ncbi:MAG: hypothetical protein JNL98_27610, partial [Bryobacterales bacterium]|nr:hypothetical protein [Bryobacterales bacterium]